ncbi:MAG: response regulator, partial [Myxococcaceae bacterium]
MAQVLIVEDERDLAQLIEFNLKQAGHAVRVANTAEDALARTRELPPDLVLLDVMLPDLSGVEICRILKSNPKTRSALVMMLTAKGEEDQRVAGFEAGADDYVTKPFSVRELALRVKAILRRTDAPAETAVRLRFGRLQIDVEGHRAWVDEDEIPLTALEFRLLTALAQRKGRVQTREALLTHVW